MIKIAGSYPKYLKKIGSIVQDFHTLLPKSEVQTDKFPFSSPAFPF